MGRVFWSKRFLTVLAGAFVVIGAAQMVRGHDLSSSAIHGGVWAVIAATVFTVSRYFQARKGQHCAICRDTPEMQHGDHGGGA
jgi:F0F1-type ATP synthase assembly protein I